MMGNELNLSAGVPCLVLVGGLGTRLRSVSNDLPKPMVKIAGHPFLEYIIRWLQKSGFRQLILCVGYRADKIREYFGNGAALGVDIAYSEEVAPLGTWGAVRQAAGLVGEPYFVVLNGDSWLELDLRGLLRFHMSKGGVATIAAVEVADSARFGSIRIGPTGRIEAFAEKGCGPSSGLVNGGMYVFSEKVLDLVPAGASSLEKDVFPILISHSVYAMRVPGFFIDIGIPAEYQRLQDRVEEWISRMQLGKGEAKC